MVPEKIEGTKGDLGLEMLALKSGSLSICTRTKTSVQVPCHQVSATFCEFTWMLALFQEEIRKGVKEMVEKFGTQRYIANLGHGVMKDTDPDHLGEFINAVHKYSEDLNAVS